MKNKIILFLLICLSSSCESDLVMVDINLESGFVPSVAVSSYLSPDSSVCLKVSMTQAAYSTNLITPKIKSATIERVVDHQIFDLTQNKKNSFVELFTNELEITTGGIYKIKIETQNPVIKLESTDTIPASTPILDANILSVDKSTNQMGRIKFKPNQTNNLTGYYELAIFKRELSDIQTPFPFYQIPLTTNSQIITREDYYPSLVLIGATNPQTLLFRHNNSEEIVTVDFIYSAGTEYFAGDVFSLAHDIRIELRSVSYAYFRYKTSLYKQGYAASGDLLYGMSAPVTVYSNITGGVGIFSGYSKADTIISVAKRTVHQN